MDEQQVRIRDDLRDVTTGDILVEDLERAAFATDASLLEVQPVAVVAPRTQEELVGVIKYAAESGLKIHPRGAGTGLAGESLGAGLVVDTSRYLTRVIAIGPESVRVEPGARWSTLSQALAPSGRMFAPDPVSGARCTIGGMIATDAAGPHALRYGATADHVLRLKLALGDGDVVEVGAEPRDAPQPADGPLGRLVSEVSSLLAEHANDIVAEQPAGLLKPGGYRLRGILTETHVDLARLLVGSEGTLAIVLEAELATLPVPRRRGLLIAAFASLEAAAHAVVESLEYLPSACELLDRRLIALIRDASPIAAKWLPENAEAVLMLEQEGSSAENVRDRVKLMGNRLERVKRLAIGTVELYREQELAQCWEARNRATPRLALASGALQPLPLIENAAVPPQRLPEFLKAVQDVMKKRGVTASYAAHAGIGVLHTRPLLDPGRPEHRRLMGVLAEDVLNAALKLGGTNNGEHGVGLLRSGFLAKQYPRLTPVFARLKSIFDPHNFLNPGRLVGATPGFPIDLLRSSAVGAESPIKPELLWNDLPIVESVERCNGCGACMTTNPAARMCPSFRAFGTEASAPRSKANLLRQALSGGLGVKVISTADFREIANYCVHCKMCKGECPSEVDISKLMLEAKAAHVAEQGMNWTDWFFSRLDSWARWGSANAVFANFLLSRRSTRFLAERFFGLSRHRRLPRFHHRTFLRRAALRGWTRKPRSNEPRPRVALLVDLYVNHLDPRLGECAVRVLEHHRRRVYVPPDQVGSGMAPLAHGDLEAARAKLERNIGIFAELAREGYDIVTPEPSAAVMFRDEAKNLVADPDLRLLAERTFEFSEYLALLAERGELRGDLAETPLAIGYHEPCHLRAISPVAPIANLMSRIPKLRLVPMNLGCSGMAGTYGLRANGFQASLTAGEPMLRRLSQPDIHFGMTQCGACRMQMEQGSGKRTLHPAHWFAVAYGLVRRPERLFQAPDPSLVGS